MATASPERPLLQSAIAIVAGIGLGAGGLLLGFLLTAVVGAVLVYGLGLTVSPALSIVLGLVFVQGIGCGGVAFAYRGARPRIAPPVRSRLGLSGDGPTFDIPASMPSLRDLLVVAGGYGTALVGAIVGSAVLSSLQVDTGTNRAAEIGMQNPEVLLVLIPASFLLIGPGEELLFRGVVQGRIREVFDPIPGVVLPSVVFAGLHWVALSGGSPLGNLAALGVLLVPAHVFGAAYEYTGNIVVPSLIHGAYNATLFTLLYVVVRFGDQLPQSALLA
ncbi:CPBP family intramembrane glutamic endopeptidase [Haloarcula litorea]|uniref:CPBP family intramembrane glutamic endopeptidase n=1 Tax=Haloarcula litorea TaxID=3032579 RepID=UPI0023E8CF59|nr:CPBP family intramembrane glutamic endopeptidase [Halomicroarcula sp. GDY20]